MNVSAMAWDPITFTVNFDDEQPGGNGHGKTSMWPPMVYIEDYNVVYTTTVYSAQTQVVLPSTLSGDYKI